MVHLRSTSGAVAPCRLVLVGGTPATRTGLAALLSGQQSRIVLVGEASGADDIVDRATRLSPDIMLLDTRLPDALLVLACRKVRERVPSAAIVLHTTQADARCVVAMALSGAAGYAPKALDGDDLVARLLMIHIRRDRPSAEIGEGLLAWLDAWNDEGDRRDRGISGRDITLLRRLIRGASDRDLAEQSGFDSATLNSEIARLYLALSDEPEFRTTGARLARQLA